MPAYSPLMKFFQLLGWTRMAWACRRLHCPVPKDALVLEVGSGGSPYFRANVLIDAYEQTRERHWVPFINDRPSVLGIGEALPFKDKAFDFVVASHVLEHSADPQHFIQELQRVAKAGYIETPDAFMERLNPYWDHRSEVTVRNGRLLVRKKPQWNLDPELVELYEHTAKDEIAGRTIVNAPFKFHTRFYWQGQIDFEILNPQVDANWTPPHFTHTTQASQSVRARMGRWVLSSVRRLFSQNRRNQGIDLKALLQCPSCGSADLRDEEGPSYRCVACSVSYAVQHKVPRMYPSGFQQA